MTQALIVQFQNRERPISWHPHLTEPLHFFEWRRVYEKGNTGGPDKPDCNLLRSAIIPDGKAAEAQLLYLHSWTDLQVMLLQTQGHLQKQIELTKRATSSYCGNRSRVARLRPASLGRQEYYLERRSKNKHGMDLVRCLLVPHRRGEKTWPLIRRVETIHLRQCNLFFTVSDCPLETSGVKHGFGNISHLQRQRESYYSFTFSEFPMYRSFHFNFLLLIKKHKADCKVTKAKFTKEKKINITGFNKE